jgi:tRNA A-37 threonylcarbamoyl transferase component Bud32
LEIISVNGKDYEIEKLLGKGKGGYSYLAKRDGKEYVLKQIHHEPCSYYQFGNKIQSEINDYKRLSNIGIKMPVMIEVDVENERILKEYIAGDTIYDLVNEDRMEAEYIRQVEEMCKMLYPANTNIDYFPTNFVVNNGEIFYIDYECNDYMEEWNFENWGIKYWSKTPEFLKYVEEHN